jgi:hypothetical protein
VWYSCIYDANKLHEIIMQRRCLYLLYELCKKNGTKFTWNNWPMENVWKTIVFWGPWSSRCVSLNYHTLNFWVIAKLDVNNYVNNCKAQSRNTRNFRGHKNNSVKERAWRRKNQTATSMNMEFGSVNSTTQNVG